MQLVLTPGEDGVAEWALIELQGTLHSIDSFAGQPIGELKWDNKKAFFQVGHHIIEGKEVKLENPFVVLRKNEQGSNVVPIMAVIRKKLLFRTRPKPI